MPHIPSFLLKKLYLNDSLQEHERGFCFVLKNSIGPATLTTIENLAVDGHGCDMSEVVLSLGDDPRFAPDIKPDEPLSFPWGTQLRVDAAWPDGIERAGRHTLSITVVTREIGQLKFDVGDRLAAAAGA